MPLVVTRATMPSDLEMVMALRTQVFIHEMGLPSEIDNDGHDADDTTLHFIGKDAEYNNECVAIARVILDPLQRTARIGRIAVRTGYRGKNYGAVLMAAVERAIATDADVFVLAALHSKKGFYERCGYACVDDDVFDVHGYATCMMTKTIAKDA